MKRKKEEMPTFYVEGRIGLCIGLEIQAKTLEEANEKAKQFKLEDFVEILGDNNDSNFEVSGVFKGGGAPRT